MIKLTGEEWAAICEAGGTTVDCGCEFCISIKATVEAIIAARVQALTAERDELREAKKWAVEKGIKFRAERDAARAELAAANARCAELEADRDWEKAQKDSLSNAADRTVAKLTDENAALQATLDRVTTLPDEWEAAEVGVPSPDTALSGNECAAALRAALTPEGKP